MMKLHGELTNWCSENTIICTYFVIKFEFLIRFAQN